MQLPLTALSPRLLALTSLTLKAPDVLVADIGHRSSNGCLPTLPTELWCEPHFPTVWRCCSRSVFLLAQAILVCVCDMFMFKVSGVLQYCSTDPHLEEAILGPPAVRA